MARAAIPKIRVNSDFCESRRNGEFATKPGGSCDPSGLQRGKYRDYVSLEVRHASTVDDLRHALLDAEQILHFSGHGDIDTLLFEDAEAGMIESPIKAISSLVQYHPSIKCVILNACNSAAKLIEPLADVTIGMERSVEDDAAIQFALGFYDAIAVGKSYDFAIDEGRIACETKGLDLPLKVVRR